MNGSAHAIAYGTGTLCTAQTKLCTLYTLRTLCTSSSSSLLILHRVPLSCCRSDAFFIETTKNLKILRTKSHVGSFMSSD
jgi:hypothetical protein